jgi:hypothetical protein
MKGYYAVGPLGRLVRPGPGLVVQLQGRRGEAPHGHGGCASRIPGGSPAVRDCGRALDRPCAGENRFEAMGGEELTRGGGSMVALLDQQEQWRWAGGGVDVAEELVSE